MNGESSKISNMFYIKIEKFAPGVNGSSGEFGDRIKVEDEVNKLKKTSVIVRLSL
jgi:hypothetical protein